MKVKIFLSALAGCLLLVSCAEEHLDSRSIFSTETPSKTSFDSWLDDNFVIPYNIEIQYRMDDMEAPFSHNMTPPSIENSKKMAWLIKHIFVDTYNEVAKSGSSFMQQYAPRIFTFIGDGDDARATAEGGLKVVLYWIDYIDFTYSNLSQTYFKTMHHEFMHILNQKVTFPADYAQISPPDMYVGSSGNSIATNTALTQGFASGYGKTNVREDIAEMYSWYVVSSPERWKEMLAIAGESGSEIINRKIGIIKTYMQSQFDVDIDRVREANYRRMNELDLLHLDNLPF